MPLMVTDPPGDRRLANRVANWIGAARVAVQGGIGGALRRIEDGLRDAAATSVIGAAVEQFDALVKEGRVRPERATAPETGTALAELVDDCKTAVSDARRFDVLRAAFLAAAAGDPADSRGAMALVYMRVARQLTAEDGAVLGSAYRRRRDQDARNDHDVRTHYWLGSAKDDTGLRFNVPLAEACARLSRLGLVRSTEGDGEWPKWLKNNGMMTDYGIAFCEFLERGEALAKPADKPK